MYLYISYRYININKYKLCSKYEVESYEKFCFPN